MYRPHRPALAALAAVCAVGTLAGCSDALTGGAVSFSSYPSVTTMKPTPQMTATLPAGFPAEVPVVPGRYRRVHSPSLGDRAYVLAVADVAGPAVERARARLLAAGYVEQEMVGQRTFIGRTHTVTVSPVGPGFGYSLLYAVLPAANIPGLPTMPDFSDLLG